MLLQYAEIHFALGPSNGNRDHRSMPSEVNGRRAQTFWKAFKIWAAIMAVPGALGTFGKGSIAFGGAARMVHQFRARLFGG
jgi:hypothetical protein